MYFLAPKKCPSCQSELVTSVTGIDLYCPNTENCPQQILLRLDYFCSRNIANIKGLSKRQIANFMEKFKIKDIYDLYKLPYQEILQLPGYQIKAVTNLQESIEKACLIEDYKLLAGLSIEGIGLENAKLICQKLQEKSFIYNKQQNLNSLVPCTHFLSSLQELNPQELLKVSGLGEVLVNNYKNFLDSSRYKRLIEKFSLLESENCFVQVKLNFLELTSSNQNLPLSKEVICITGTFKLSRLAIQEKLQKLGATVVSNLSSKTTILLVGENPGSKLARAKNFVNIQIVTDLEKLLS